MSVPTVGLLGFFGEISCSLRCEHELEGEQMDSGRNGFREAWEEEDKQRHYAMGDTGWRVGGIACQSEPGSSDPDTQHQRVQPISPSGPDHRVPDRAWRSQCIFHSLPWRVALRWPQFRVTHSETREEAFDVVG